MTQSYTVAQGSVTAQDDFKLCILLSAMTRNCRSYPTTIDQTRTQLKNRIRHMSQFWLVNLCRIWILSWWIAIVLKDGSRHILSWGLRTFAIALCCKIFPVYPALKTTFEDCWNDLAVCRESLFIERFCLLTKIFEESFIFSEFSKYFVSADRTGLCDCRI